MCLVVYLSLLPSHFLLGYDVGTIQMVSNVTGESVMFPFPSISVFWGDVGAIQMLSNMTTGQSLMFPSVSVFWLNNHWT